MSSCSLFLSFVAGAVCTAFVPLLMTTWSLEVCFHPPEVPTINIPKDLFFPNYKDLHIRRASDPFIPIPTNRLEKSVTSEQNQRDKDLLAKLFYENHLLRGQYCERLDPASVKVVRAEASLQGGFGNIISWLLIPLHSALILNATFVGSKVAFGGWHPLEEQDIFVLSPCHHLFHTGTVHFPNQVEILANQGSSHQHTKHPLFRHRSLLWYYRELLKLFFTDVVFDRFFDKYGNHPSVRNRMALQTTPRVWRNWDHWKQENIDNVAIQYSTKIGIHIRRADSCFKNINAHRPPCQPTEVYVKHAVRYLEHLQKNAHHPLFLLSSDDPTGLVFREFHDLILNGTRDSPRLDPIVKGIGTYYLDIDRSIYNPPHADIRIEHFVTGENNILSAWTDFLMELSMFSQADVIIAQFYSTFADIALLASPNIYQYSSVDGALPCARGGCVGPLDQSGGANVANRLSGWNRRTATITSGVDNALFHYLRVIEQHGGKSSAFLADSVWVAAFDIERLWTYCFASPESDCDSGRDCLGDIVQNCFY